MRLTQEQLQALEPKQRETYLELERLFRTKGWGLVVKMAQDNAQVAFNAAATASTWAANRIAVGNQAAWLAFVNLEDQTQHDYEMMASGNAKSAQETKQFEDEDEYE